uniref:Uncharacterized protein n=1 Tax=Nelumbo nucifera TaxID=4432 RepID=A0A822Z4Q3_NELNU|nr:TPA_asm: hypothetical protein HUJ06_007159 [Nelumbo nucifera]
MKVFIFAREFTFSRDPTNPSLLSSRFPRRDPMGCSCYWRTKNHPCCCALLYSICTSACVVACEVGRPLSLAVEC